MELSTEPHFTQRKKKQRQKEKKGMNNVVYNSQQGFFSLYGGSLIFLHPSLWPEHKDAQTLSFERLSRHIVLRILWTAEGIVDPFSASTEL